MGRGLKTIVDLLELCLNFLVVLTMETALDAVAGRTRAPLWALCLPFVLPVAFYGARRWAQKLPLFLLLHGLALAGLFGAAGRMPVPLLWQISWMVLGVFYVIHSIKVRIVRQEDSEGECPPMMAAFVAVGMFLLCGRAESQTGCGRILWLTFAWILGNLFKNYLENFIAYVEMNRRSAGAMPERSIFQTGLLLVAGYSGFSVALLVLCARTPLVGWLSGAVKRFGLWFLRLLISFLPETGETGSGQTAAESIQPERFGQMLPEASAPPIWWVILEKIITTGFVLLMLLGAVYLVFVLIRFLIVRFYSRDTKISLQKEGYTEEQERLEGFGRMRRKRLPVIGGTPAQRVRRSFQRAVQTALTEEQDGQFSPKTARELGQMAGIDAAAQWTALVQLYEQARYDKAAVSAEDARAAVKLSRRICHLQRYGRKSRTE